MVYAIERAGNYITDKDSSDTLNELQPLSPVKGLQFATREPAIDIPPTQWTASFASCQIHSIAPSAHKHWKPTLANLAFLLVDQPEGPVRLAAATSCNIRK
jgi:hypothetical protein